MNFSTVQLFIVLAIIATFVEVKAKPQMELGYCDTPCYGGTYDTCRKCGTRCPLTCDSQPNAFCTYDCIPNVCQCDTGFARARDGKCIPYEQCPQNNY